MRDSALPGLISTKAGFQLIGELSDYVITVQPRDETGAAEQGEVVGTLHVKLWKSAESDANLMAWLDHNTTTVTLNEQRVET